VFGREARHRPIKPWSLVGSYRPVPIGVSVGTRSSAPRHDRLCAQRGSKKYLLSGITYSRRQNQGTIGESIVQPSLPTSIPLWSAPPAAVIGTLADFQTVVYDAKTPNDMDAAIAAFTLPPAS